MTSLERVENKIRELCPELMELTFGCEVKTKTWGTVKITAYEDEGKDESYMCYVLPDRTTGDEDGLVFYEKEIIEIIGHPIHLEHVLRAIEKKGYYIRSDGTFFKWEKFTDGGDGHHGVKSTYVTYKLSLPSNQQPQPVIELLERLLVD